MTPARRWLPFVGAALATMVLAGGFGFAANQFAAPRAQPAPHLKTVSTATLTKLGITLSAPVQPVYCGVAGVAVSHGWLRQGAAGCAISQASAVSAASQGRSGQVLESVLALVDSTRLTAVGREHLAWVVVAQQSLGACPVQISGLSLCPSPKRFTSTQVVLVDAYGGGVFTRFRVSALGGRAAPAYSNGSFLGG